MTFSGALTLTDLNDFITPSQACIKPVEQLDEPEQQADVGGAATQIHIDAAGGYYEVTEGQAKEKPSKKLQKAQISLNDCLACSGCITSAESVLITLQSHAEVFSFLASNPPPTSPSHKIPILSISPQTLASLAASISASSDSPIPLSTILRRVKAFSAQIGFAQTFDTTFSRHLSLLEHTREFLERRAVGPEAKLPMLASACPGWVCYAEKTHPEMLPFISRTKSPQQVMGALIKNWMAQKCGRSPDQIYHVTVMPCYDKKLEASRQDFYNEAYSTRDVDCVITTGELDLMMRERGWDLSIPVGDERLSHAATLSGIELPELLTHPGTSSGSYLHTLITTLSNSIPNPSLSTRAIRTSDYEEYVLTNADTGEVVFKGAKCYGFRNLQNVVRKVGKEAGVQVGRGAAAGRMAGGMGPRARRKPAGGAQVDEDVKRYDYVEVMACPGGCVNGGGQLRPLATKAGAANSMPPATDEEGFQRNWDNTGVRLESDGIEAGWKWANKDWVKRVEESYWHDLPTPPASPPALSRFNLPETLIEKSASLDPADKVARQILRELCLPTSDLLSWYSIMDEEAERRRTELFRTQYHAVESEVIGLAVKW